MELGICLKTIYNAITNNRWIGDPDYTVDFDSLYAMFGTYPPCPQTIESLPPDPDCIAGFVEIVGCHLGAEPGFVRVVCARCEHDGFFWPCERCGFDGERRLIKPSAG